MEILVDNGLCFGSQCEVRILEVSVSLIIWLHSNWTFLIINIFPSLHLQFTSVQYIFSSVMSDSLDPTDCSTPGLPVHHQLPEFAQTPVHWVSADIWPFHPLSSPSPPAFNLSQHQGLFQWVRSLHQVAKVLEFQLSISLSNGYSGLISFGMDWLDLLAVQGTLKSLLQHHSSKASILWCSDFFILQLSHQYMTNGKKHSFD